MFLPILAFASSLSSLHSRRRRGPGRYFSHGKNTGSANTFLGFPQDDVIQPGLPHAHISQVAEQEPPQGLPRHPISEDDSCGGSKKTGSISLFTTNNGTALPKTCWAHGAVVCTYSTYGAETGNMKSFLFM
ncbi:hypothetical protein E2C01_054131 [Portunus trituberculatus]|uniref:Uncharacterized protein n=1 Tax=Portunus trituberculatus TaxID=210409 RepID=A0A5B7GRY9_PORTR|nr:hypothetical protein [Portunus trituberculatus]